MLRISLEDLSATNEAPPSTDAKGFPFTKGNQMPDTASRRALWVRLLLIEQKSRFV